MYRLIGIKGYEYTIVQDYVADTAADVDNIPTICYAYGATVDGVTLLYTDSAHEHLLAGASNKLYIILETNTYCTFENDAFTVLLSEPVKVNYAQFGSSVNIIGDGSGLVVKMLNSTGTWVQVSPAVVV